MTRLLRLVLVPVMLAASLLGVQLAVPLGAMGCSCMITGPEVIGTFADEPEIVVFVGTVVSVGPDVMGHLNGELAVELVFKGDIPSSRMPVVGGGGGDCTISIEPGQRMVTAATFSGGAITPGLCMPYGDPATPEGQRLIAEAVKAYGPGAPPRDAPTRPPEPPAAPTSGAGAIALPVVLGLALGAAVALFGVVVLLTRRGRASE